MFVKSSYYSYIHLYRDMHVYKLTYELFFPMSRTLSMATPKKSEMSFITSMINFQISENLIL